MFVCRFNTSPHQDIVPVKVQRKQPTVRAGAEWEWPPSPRVHRHALPVTENGPAGSFFALQDQQQQLEHQKLPEPGAESETTLSPSPVHSLDADLDIPVETDIDDFQDDNGLPTEDEPITSELPCFALPVTVLETDIDTLAEHQMSPAAESASLEEEEEPEGGERLRERLSLEELFPHSNDGEAGTEGWREVEHNTDSLDR